jgi:hypothetical protein
MRLIQLSAVPSQELSVLLNDQNCQIKVYQKTLCMFFDLSIDNVPVVTGRVIRDRCKLIRYRYFDFSGDLIFVDSQGLDDPFYTGLGDRFNLYYIEPSDTI